MAALTFHAIHAIVFLGDLTDAFVRYGFDVHRSYRCLLAKQRQRLFCRYCRELCLRYQDASLDRKSSETVQEKPAESQKESLNRSKVNSALKMQRRGIDFAAIEASSEAYEAIDSFMAEERRVAELPAQRSPGDYVHSFEDIEVITGTEVDATFYDYAEHAPVLESNLGPPTEGTSVTFKGYILPTCERFSINFIINNETRDLALHINPRLPQNYIVRNSKVKNLWGREEVTSALPFTLHRGSKFAVQVLITEACYMISVNGHHFATYQHRVPYRAVTAIEVKGDVSDVTIDTEEVTSYPERLPETESTAVRVALTDIKRIARDIHIPDKWRIIPNPSLPIHAKELEDVEMGLPMPYYGRLPENALSSGRYLRVQGRIKLLPHSFYINLQRGQYFWPHPIVAFHFNPRFSKMEGAIGKAIVCRNAWSNGSWGQEERSELDTDFRPGKTFSLSILCGDKEFQVYLNHKLICEYQYRVQPNGIDTVYIQGDVKLWDVALKNNFQRNAHLHKQFSTIEDF